MYLHTPAAHRPEGPLPPASSLSIFADPYPDLATRSGFPVGSDHPQCRPSIFISAGRGGAFLLVVH